MADVLAALAADWEGYELRFSALELVVTAHAVRSELAGIVPDQLISDIGLPGPEVIDAVRQSLAARGILQVSGDSAELKGPGGALLAALLSAPIRITGTTIGDQIATRRRWHVRSDIAVSQVLVDADELIFGFTPGAPSRVLPELIDVCGLPDERTDAEDEQDFNVAANLEVFLQGTAIPGDPLTRDRIWILREAETSLGSAPADLEEVRLVQWIDIVVDSASVLPTSTTLAWLFDQVGERWLLPPTTDLWTATRARCQRVGGRNIVDQLATLLPK